MQIADYYPILVQILIAASVGVVVLVVSHIFGQRGQDTEIKNTPYECGMLAEGSGHARFAVKFYVTAMLFILFDIEVVFLIPWVMVFREFLAANLPIIMPVFFFLFVLLLSFQVVIVVRYDCKARTRPKCHHASAPCGRRPPYWRRRYHRMYG